MIKKNSSKLEKDNKKRKINSTFKTIIKIFLLIFIIYGFYTLYNSYSNSITLLAVNEDVNGNPLAGSLVKLNLKITPGSGQIYTNLNTIEEIDTQISIINSQKIACNLFSLSCEKYDFYYTFEGSALVLKGPSASSAIAILTAKTINHEKIDNKAVITGSLNSGGIIGSVGGVEQKIKVANKNNFTKILIPEFSEYNQTKLSELNLTIEIIPTYDLVIAYNNFNGDTFQLKNEKINNEKYLTEMKKLSSNICARSNELKKEINQNQIIENTTLDNYLKQAKASINSSNQAENISNFYSRGSFCYNSNINYRLIIETQKNITFEDREKLISELNLEIDTKYTEFMSKEYQENIQTTNDFYVYLLMINRIKEAKEYLKEADKLQITKLNTTIENITIKNKTTITINKTENITNKTENINTKQIEYYSYAKERYFTVLVWENFITHSGDKITFSEEKIAESCHKINHEISIKSELLNNYGLTYLNTEINKQNKFENPLENKYECLYTGFELNGKLNTILNSIGMTDENQENYTLKMIEFTNTRIALNSNGKFPLIPYMYSEYSKDLYNQSDFSSALLYSNYALSYADLNLYLESETKNISYFNWLVKELFSNVLFVSAILVLAIFL